VTGERVTERKRIPRRDDSGVALIIMLMALTLLLALGLALSLTTSIETRIAANYREAVEALYAADAGVERAIQDLTTLFDWDGVLNGTVTSSFNDGPPHGLRSLPGGATIDLTQATNVMRCGKNSCSADDLTTVSDDRPWGTNNPVWQPFAYGPVAALAAGTIDSRMYLVVWIADDPSENDNAPLRDGAPPAGCNVEKDPTCADDNVGRGVIAMRAQALGPMGTRRTLDVTLGRVNGSEVRIVSWREIR
jgi:hypothetical protein